MNRPVPRADVQTRLDALFEHAVIQPSEKVAKGGKFTAKEAMARQKVTGNKILRCMCTAYFLQIDLVRDGDADYCPACAVPWENVSSGRIKEIAKWHNGTQKNRRNAALRLVDKGFSFKDAAEYLDADIDDVKFFMIPMIRFRAEGGRINNKTGFVFSRHE